MHKRQKFGENPAMHASNTAEANPENGIFGYGVTLTSDILTT